MYVLNPRCTELLIRYIVPVITIHVKVMNRHVLMKLAFKTTVSALSSGPRGKAKWSRGPIDPLEFTPGAGAEFCIMDLVVF
jgi:hypothetical protein